MYPQQIQRLISQVRVCITQKTSPVLNKVFDLCNCHAPRTDTSVGTSSPRQDMADIFTYLPDLGPLEEELQGIHHAKLLRRF